MRELTNELLRCSGIETVFANLLHNVGNAAMAHALKNGLENHLYLFQGDCGLSA
jgi:hypothetical protein